MQITLEHVQFLQTLLLGIFSGAALFINVGEHPARMSALHTADAVSQWQPSYKAGLYMQGGIMIVVMISGFTAYFKFAGAHWYMLLNAIVALVMWLYTVICMMPINNTLMALKTREEKGTEQAKHLLVKWNRLHAVRSFLGTAAFALTLYFLCFNKTQ